jgi:hypothetical protein
LPLFENIKIINKIAQSKSIAIFLFLTAAGLTLASLLEVLTAYYLPDEVSLEVLQIFNSKGAAPTAFLVFQLFVCSFLLGLISKIAAENEGNRDVWSWRFLSIIFLFLSCDELLGIHHIAVEGLGQAFDGAGRYSYKWVIVYAPLILLFGFCYLKFLRRLPEKTRNLFVLSGTITLFGAYLLEIPLGKIDHFYGHDGLSYGIFAVLKKSFELFGVAIFVYALLHYIEANLINRNPVTLMNNSQRVVDFTKTRIF